MKQPWLGVASGDGDNSIYKYTGYEVYASYGCNIMARYNYWGWPGI